MNHFKTIAMKFPFLLLFLSITFGLQAQEVWAVELRPVGFPKNRTVINSNLLTLNSNCHNENKQV